MPKRNLLRPAALVSAFLVFAADGASAQDLSFSCTGAHIRHRGSFPSTSKETVTLKQSQGHPVSVGLPDESKPVDAETVSENPITMVLRTPGLTLQYFKQTGQLYVIHDDSGRLTRLACSKGN